MPAAAASAAPVSAAAAYSTSASYSKPPLPGHAAEYDAPVSLLVHDGGDHADPVTAPVFAGGPSLTAAGQSAQVSTNPARAVNIAPALAKMKSGERIHGKKDGVLSTLTGGAFKDAGTVGFRMMGIWNFADYTVLFGRPDSPYGEACPAPGTTFVWSGQLHGSVEDNLHKEVIRRGKEGKVVLMWRESIAVEQHEFVGSLKFIDLVKPTQKSAVQVSFSVHRWPAE